jgi:hypothetical protein
MNRSSIIDIHESKLPDNVQPFRLESDELLPEVVSHSHPHT